MARYVGDELQYIDEALLPEVSLDEHNLSFTVVRGRVIGDFSPNQDDAVGAGTQLEK